MKIFWLVICLAISEFAHSQSTKDTPKLVIGIVVDQMKNEYLFRYADHYGKDGFKKLMHKGFYAANQQYSYVPTKTGPGHASIFTGTTPSVHGIIANNWYSREMGRVTNCVEDTSVNGVGTDSDVGHRSPLNLKTTTITDELRMFWNFRSKVVGISFKDKAAILPAGHVPNGAYWFENGNFVTSTFYTDRLPQWVSDFNTKKLPDIYLNQVWNPLLPLDEYTASNPDDSPNELVWKGETKSTFPHDLKQLSKENNPDDILRHSPFGNTFIFDFAREAIKSENLGQDDITDFLTINLASPDDIGHAYGTRSVEIEDVYLRLDADLANFIKMLDKEVGKGNYVLFSTGDHGGAETPQFNIDHKLPGGYFDRPGFKDTIESVLKSFSPSGNDLIEGIENQQIYLNRKKIASEGLNFDEIAAALTQKITAFPGVYSAYETSKIIRSAATDFPIVGLRRGLNPQLSGDVVYILKSGWLRYGHIGTNHISPWKYDTNVPLLMYGKGIRKGTCFRETNTRDIAPTLSVLLHIPYPSGCTGTPISEALKK